ncbi:MAG TPA: hypothetical protein VMU06_12940 [Stellaceae bacterium]|nr:hypothetical protein [Stellaceae bacterium]
METSDPVMALAKQIEAARAKYKTEPDGDGRDTLCDIFCSLQGALSSVPANTLAGVIYRLKFVAEVAVPERTDGSERAIFPWQFALLGAIDDLQRLAGTAVTP